MKHVFIGPFDVLARAMMGEKVTEFEMICDHSAWTAAAMYRLPSTLPSYTHDDSRRASRPWADENPVSGVTYPDGPKTTAERHTA